MKEQNETGVGRFYLETSIYNRSTSANHFPPNLDLTHFGPSVTD